MKKVLIAVMMVVVLFFVATAHAESYDKIVVKPSQPYLRTGMNDTITLTVQLYSGDAPAHLANVLVAFSLRAGSEYTSIDKAMALTDQNGQATANVSINPDNPPEPSLLPCPVQVEVVTDQDHQMAYAYLTGIGSVSGYVVDGEKSTITGANITVSGPNGIPLDFLTQPIQSGNGSDSTIGSMGYYRIDGLPTGMGTYEITAEKSGYTGTSSAEAMAEPSRSDIVIPDYRDFVNVSQIVTENKNSTPTPTITPTPAPTPQPARPTSMTTTIVVAIILIALIYIGLKAYRRMF